MTSSKEYLELIEEGERRMKERAIAAAKKTIDLFYDNGQDLAFDYLGFFKENM